MQARKGALAIGVDAGGTRTVALVGRVDDPGAGGRGEAGPANPQVRGFAAAAGEIVAAVGRALADAGAEGPAARVVVGVAGGGRRADQEQLADLLAEHLGRPTLAVRVVPDLALILPAAGLEHGVALIAGTGSSAYGVGLDGQVFAAGGWGYLFGDEGSAYDVGRRALRAAARGVDGGAPGTRLTDALLRRLGVDSARDLVPAVYQAPSPRVTIAALAPTVVEVARAGDESARAILQRAAESLAEIAAVAARRLAMERGCPVVCAGGLFRAGAPLMTPLTRAARERGLTDVRLLEREPVEGALRLAIGVCDLGPGTPP